MILPKPIDQEKPDGLLTNILQVLGRKDALNLFYLAGDGFRSNSDFKNTLDLHDRRYYRRLRDLVKANLLKKGEENNIYELTLVGKILHETLFNDISSLLPKIDMIEKLRELDASRSSKLTHLSFSVDDELTEISRRLAFQRANAYIVTEYDDLVKALAFQIQRSGTQVLLASKYYDFKILDYFARAIEKGVSIYNITDMKMDIPKIFIQLKEFLNEPRLGKMYREMVTSPLLQYRFMKLPFSFMIVDNVNSCFELTIPKRKEFFSAIFIESEEIAQHLKKIFMLYWETAHKLPEVDRLDEEC
jgi:predicted transcriptional regulator